MKEINNLLSRLRKKFLPRQGKKGSSLAFVMAIGAALVIWVMCIMPLMVNTGIVAMDTQTDLLAYLQNRSAIEFAKSQLEYQSLSDEYGGLPSTFVIVKAGDNRYFARDKWPEPTAKPQNPIAPDNGQYSYADYVSEYPSGAVSANSDADDVPQHINGVTTATGMQVAAICTVEENETGSYDILITTYHNGEKGMVYAANFTPSGSLKIHPEAYNNGDALPLSDFVLVDGKLGANRVWNSGITMSNAGSLNFLESLLIVKTADEMASLPGYADAGEYPAVFKTTAHTASSTDEESQIGEPVQIGHLSSDEIWYQPKAVASSASNKQEGNIWYTADGNGMITVWMKTNGGDLDITSKCIVYFNGIPSPTKPTKTGSYAVTVDYVGTDYSTPDNPEKYDETKTNVLPVAGLKWDQALTVGDHGTTTLAANFFVGSIEEIIETDDEGNVISITYTVTIDSRDVDIEKDKTLMFGCINAKTPKLISWQSSPVFDNLQKTDSYFFYVCRPATFNAATGTFTSASEVKPAGVVFPVVFATELSNNGKYAIANTNGDVLYQSGNNLTTANSNIYTNIGGAYGYIGVDQNLNAYTWTATENNNAWNFTYAPNNQKLTVSGKAKGIFSTKAGNHNPGMWQGSHSCTEYTYQGFEFENVTVSLGNGSNFTVVKNGDFVMSTVLSDTIKWRKYNECSNTGNNGQQTKNVSQKFYLDLNSNVASANDTDETKVRFIAIPTAPDFPEAYSKSHNLSQRTVTYEPEGIGLGFTGNPNVLTVFANGEEVVKLDNGKYNLNAGSYSIVIRANSDGRTYYSNAGTLTVAKASLPGEITVTVAPDEEDHLSINVTATGWDTNGGYHWFGYRTITKSGNTETKSEYKWFSTLEVSHAIRLNYGTYEFAVKETGSNNYEATGEIPNAGVRLSIEYPKAELIKNQDEWKFQYTLDDEQSPTWYKTAYNIYPERIRMAYAYEKKGTLTGRTETVWYTEFKGQSFTQDIFGIGYRYTFLNTYGIQVKNSNYEWTNGDTANANQVFQIGSSYSYEELNGHAPSMLRGSSLYFMGIPSINTYGVDVTLSADLLVLGSGFTSGAVAEDKSNIVVNAYTPDKDTVLLYAKTDIQNGDGMTIFGAGMFYELPSGIDIYNLETPMIGTESELGGVTSAKVKSLFRKKAYPNINMDITNASRQQLSRILSSETIGWTVNGKLSGSSSTSNAGYCVTTYVTQIDSQNPVSYKANRIFVAAGKEASYTLTVPKNLTFTARYLSVDAEQIVQGAPDVKFTLNNLALDTNFIQALSNALGITNNSSKTLQMDYERTMLINGTSIPAQIVRYSHGANLFANPVLQPLIATYTTSEIEQLFRNGLSGLASTVKTVDRYVSLVPTEGNTSIDLSALLSVNLDIYANYVYFDPDITGINLSSWLDSDITIGTQESGYTTHEYLGLFKTHSAESYSGTILYFGSDLTISYPDGRVTIPKGFYRVRNDVNFSEFGNASNFSYEDGKTKIEIILRFSDQITDPERYYAGIEKLKLYSVYINPKDGTISDTYVDTGLDDNSSGANAGFSGGGVK